MELDISKLNKVFFIGIGGIGISALAKMVIAQGMIAEGVNDEISPKTLDPLIEIGAKIIYKHEMNEIPEADLYVYSDAWPFRGPEIIEAARATGKPVLSYFEAVGKFTRKYQVIGLSGTHGKTTTTAMTGEVLIDGGLDPTVFVGSITKRFNSNFRLGKSEYLVIEADEFKRHFLNFYPYISVITNIEADHFETYKDLSEIVETFQGLIDQTSDFLIVNPKALPEGLDLGNRLKVVDYTTYLDKVPKLSVPGEHNRMNAACVLAIAEILDIPYEIASKSLAEFQGTWRRLENKGFTKDGAVVYDDYAHHPTEIRAGLSALRELYPGKEINVVFQPHMYSRTKALFDDFVTCFEKADKVFLLPIYFAREAPDPTVSSEQLAEAMTQNGSKVASFLDFKSAEDAISDISWGPDKVFVTMGAGDAYKIAEAVFKIS